MRPVLLSAVLAIALGAAGCSGDDEPTSAQSAKPTPIERLNTDALDLSRTSFCTRLPASAVEEAVEGRPGRGTAWRNGDMAEIEPGLTDVVHEYGCRWTADGTTARAWIFARPFTADDAAAVIVKTSKRSGCESVEGPDFGSPSQRQTCTLDDGGTRVRVAGLIGASWVSCEISGAPGQTAAEVSTRTDAWCVQVANAANTTK